MGFLNKLLRSRKTVFTFRELTMLWNGVPVQTALSRVHYYVKNNQLYQIRNGIYSKDKVYDVFELATKIFKPSYISFETVLGMEGVIFQKYNSVFLASYQTKVINCDGNEFTFKKLKDSVLLNDAGIINKDDIMIATRERALLDVLYLNKDYYFDNILSVDFDKAFKLLDVYNNKRMEADVKRLQKHKLTEAK
jgi:predicted transcriptional regulator of viral defense system